MNKTLQICILVFQIILVIALLILFLMVQKGCSANTDYWKHDKVPTLRLHTKQMISGKIKQYFVISNPKIIDITGKISCSNNFLEGETISHFQVNHQSDKVLSMLLPNYPNQCELVLD